MAAKSNTSNPFAESSQAFTEAPVDYGDKVLNDIEAFLCRHIAMPSDAAAPAITLWAAHTHFLGHGAFESTPRLLVCSAEPASGKTRVLELLETVCPNAIAAVNVTPSYLFRKVGDEAGMPTILFDEVDTVFGPKAKDNEEIRGFLNAGHRRGAVAGRCVTRGKVIETEEIEAFCSVAMAGLGFVPDTIMSRSIIVRMRRRAAGEKVEAWRRRLHEPEGHALRDRLADWAACVADVCGRAFPEMPAEVVDRDADVWEPLLAIADAAGGDWPLRARVAAVALVAEAKRKPPSLGIRLLADVRKVFGDADVMATEALLHGLQALDEAPWADLKGKPIDARALSRILGDYDIKSTTVRIGASTPKGYRRGDLVDAWIRYLPSTPEESATAATAATDVAPAPLSDIERDSDDIPW